MRLQPIYYGYLNPLIDKSTILVPAIMRYEQERKTR